jgi:chemotaxis protein MotB
LEIGMRRSPGSKPQNHERWVISYADFITLLLAFFVVMYAVSTVNSSKFQQMAEAFASAFMGKVPTIRDSGMAAAEKAPFDNLPSPVRAPVVTREPQVKHLPHALRQQVEQQAEKLVEAYEKLTQLLANMIREGQVRVTLKSIGVVIDINAVVLFNSGKAELTPAALQLIEQIASVLKDLNYRIQVNGFTDNAPIHSAQFDSNWDLSAARAISVVKRFVSGGIDPMLLVGAGYGEYHPVASNDTLEGMAVNRRVSIVVVSPTDGKDSLKTPLFGAPHERSATTGEGVPETSTAPNLVTPELAAQAGGCSGGSSEGDPC